MRGYLVAETDASGKVEWVWVRHKGQRLARPVDRSAFQVSDIRGFEVHGASELAVRNWLERDQTALSQR
ncbi:MAG: hypothetical protein AAFQ04_08010 [Pseudomonadota bacterium]